MSRTIALTSAEGGINRLKTRGGAKPTELYDLLNGYVDARGSIVSRPGTVRHVTLPANTRGLCAQGGELVVFSHTAQAIGAATPTVRCEILPHPDNPGVALHDIHYAGPFLGFLYVAAEFEDGLVKHYWLQSWGAWEANSVYQAGGVVEPTTPNGYGYKATRSGPANAPWAPNVLRAVGDRVEPTTPNGYYYEVVEVIGANPTSGATEPTWPEIENAWVIEEVDGAQVQTPPDPDGYDPDPSIPPDVIDRYRNISGRWGRFGP